MPRIFVKNLGLGPIHLCDGKTTTRLDDGFYGEFFVDPESPPLVIRQPAPPPAMEAVPRDALQELLFVVREVCEDAEGAIIQELAEAQDKYDEACRQAAEARDAEFNLPEALDKFDRACKGRDWQRSPGDTKSSAVAMASRAMRADDAS